MGKVVKDVWDAVYLEGAKCGHFHTVIWEADRQGKKVLGARLAMDLKVKRYNAVVPLRMETGDEETAEGKVLGLTLTQFLDKGQMTLLGQVDGNILTVRASNQQVGRKLPWNESVLGLATQDRQLQERKVKPGDKFEYLSYEMSLLTAVRVKVEVQKPEEVDLLAVKKEGTASKVDRVKKTLLRIEATPDDVEVGGNKVPLPRLVSWVDDDKQVLRSQMELPGLGQITLYRTSKEVALEEGAAPALLPDLGLTSLIALDRRIPQAHQASEVVYRITVKGTDDPATLFARDGRQQVRNVKGRTFELQVSGARPPEPVANVVEPKDEYRKSSFFLNSDDAEVKSLAAKAVGDENDPWRRAQGIEKWVHKNMTGTSAIGFNTASQVAKDLKGDCRQHAMLTAAMCRAAGVPSRTALGLVYALDPDRGPFLAFHMWTEVWIKGQWLGLDATLGQGHVGAGHLKIVDASWHDVQTLAPMIPVIRVMGRIGVEVAEVK